MLQFEALLTPPGPRVGAGFGAKAMGSRGQATAPPHLVHVVGQFVLVEIDPPCLAVPGGQNETRRRRRRPDAPCAMHRRCERWRPFVQVPKSVHTERERERERASASVSPDLILRDEAPGPGFGKIDVY